jgi:hypothetical protein
MINKRNRASLLNVAGRKAMERARLALAPNMAREHAAEQFTATSQRNRIRKDSISRSRFDSSLSRLSECVLRVVQQRGEDALHEASSDYVLADYVLEPLWEGAEFTLFRGRQYGTLSPVLVVALDAPPSSPQSLRRLEHEYSLAAELDPAWAANRRF